MGTGMVSRQISILEESPGTYGHRTGARKHSGTGMEPGHIYSPEWYPDTFWHRKGAQAHMGTGRVSEHIWNLGMKDPPGVIPS